MKLLPFPPNRAPSWGAYDSRTPSEPYGTGTGGHGGGSHQQYNQQYNPATQYAPAGQHGAAEAARAAEPSPPQVAASDQPPPAAGSQTAAAASPMPIPAPSSAEPPKEGVGQATLQQQRFAPPPTVDAEEVSIVGSLISTN